MSSRDEGRPRQFSSGANRAKVLLVGLGNAGMLYDTERAHDGPVRSHAGVFSSHGRFDLAAGVDPLKERRELFIESYGASAFSDVGEAARRTQPAVAVVASPTELHLEHVRSILAASRPKVLLCEKPIAWSPQDARTIVDLCSAADCDLFVNYQRRAEAAVRTARQLFSGSPSAFPFRGVCWYSKGVLHNASHFVDLLTYWFGRPVGAVATRNMVPYGRFDGELDFRLDFNFGDVTFLCVGNAEFPIYRLELTASHGNLRYDGSSNRYLWEDSTASFGSRQDGGGHVIEACSRGAFFEVAEQIARVLDGEKTDLCDGASASETVTLLSGLMSSEGC